MEDRKEKFEKFCERFKISERPEPLLSPYTNSKSVAHRRAFKLCREFDALNQLSGSVVPLIDMLNISNKCIIEMFELERTHECNPFLFDLYVDAVMSNVALTDFLGETQKYYYRYRIEEIREELNDKAFDAVVDGDAKDADYSNLNIASNGVEEEAECFDDECFDDDF